jgi:acyl-CoA thioester hydrolase
MFKLKVYYEDTDAVGFVYYANYLKFLERARTQLLLDSGFTHTFLKENFNIITVVKSCEIDFIKPAKLDDDLEISTSLNKKSKIQLFLDQNIFCDNMLVVKAKVRIVTLNIEGKVSRMPLDLFNIF